MFCWSADCLKLFTMECINCAETTKKYKCSKCSAPYCSVSCYKAHKDSPQCEELVEAAKAKQPQSDRYEEEEPTVYAPFTTDDTVPPEKLQQLEQSESLRELLYNPHLRNLLKQIDVAHNVPLAMTAAMQEPLFVEFANACLHVLEPINEAERAEFELCS
ncbi:zinc finger HIT domain-containing protein 3 [Drosophila willistoni]|nr:zinc finger HIT domain-containing protein 3 [Drosophila willistoni]